VTPRKGSHTRCTNTLSICMPPLCIYCSSIFISISIVMMFLLFQINPFLFFSKSTPRLLLCLYNSHLCECKCKGRGSCWGATM
jgi:hypothetical protein